MIKTRIEPVESWGKHVLEIYINGKWVTFHTDYLAVVERMQKLLQQASEEALNYQEI